MKNLNPETRARLIIVVLGTLTTAMGIAVLAFVMKDVDPETRARLIMAALAFGTALLAYLKH